MKIQEPRMLAFIAKPFLKGKAEINLVFEAWGLFFFFLLFCSVCLIYRSVMGRGK